MSFFTIITITNLYSKITPFSIRLHYYFFIRIINKKT